MYDTVQKADRIIGTTQFMAILHVVRYVVQDMLAIVATVRHHKLSFVLALALAAAYKWEQQKKRKCGQCTRY